MKRSLIPRLWSLVSLTHHLRPIYPYWLSMQRSLSESMMTNKHWAMSLRALAAFLEVMSGMHWWSNTVDLDVGVPVVCHTIHFICPCARFYRLCPLRSRLMAWALLLPRGRPRHRQACQSSYSLLWFGWLYRLQPSGKRRYLSVQLLDILFTLDHLSSRNAIRNKSKPLRPTMISIVW